MNHQPVLSFVIPCLNEAATLGRVINDCHRGGESCGCSYEIIVADNGSTDGSQQIARASGAQVVAISERGYGAALLGGIQAATGTYIIMGDADGTYAFEDAARFLKVLQEGHDLVMGNRFRGEIAPGAMPFLHRYLGNPVLSALGRTFFGITLGDFHCGLRAFRREAVLALNLQCTGMEFASEMVIKSSLIDLTTSEIPTSLRPNPPGRQPHLKTWRDGWRHLKFMLSFSPKYSFFPLILLLMAVSAILICLYISEVDPFSGPNTLVFSLVCLVMALGISTDYLSTREMLDTTYTTRKSSFSRRLDRLMGLHKGTDRMFRLAALAMAGSLFGFLVVVGYALRDRLHERMAAVANVTASMLLVSSVFLYLAAAKITTYRSLHTPGFRPERNSAHAGPPPARTDPHQ